jgi:transcription initiation factor IIE alpha subunit
MNYNLGGYMEKKLIFWCNECGKYISQEEAYFDNEDNSFKHNTCDYAVEYKQ